MYDDIFCLGFEGYEGSHIVVNHASFSSIASY